MDNVQARFFWTLIRYKETLTHTVVKIHNDPLHIAKKKTRRLISRWIMGAPCHQTTLWPLQSIAVKADFEYARRKGGLTVSVDEAMEMCQHVYNYMSSCHLERVVNRVPRISTISTIQQNMLQDRCTLDISEQNIHQNRILFWFGLIGTGMQVSVPPQVINDIVDVELFGSTIDSCADKYCSVLHTEKQFYGAEGTYQDFLAKHPEGFETHTVLLANPPLDTTIIDNFTTYLLEVLPLMKNTTVIVVLPCWDGHRQKQFNLWQSGEPMISFNKLHQSQLSHNTSFLDKDTYLFFDYFKNSFRTASDSELISLSSPDCTPLGELVHMQTLTTWISI